MTSPVFTPLQMFFNTSGAPLTDGYLYIGTASQNPQTNPIAVYWDAAGTIPAAQPIRTSGGYPVRNGSPATVFVLATDFSLIVRDKSSKLVFSRLSGNAFSAEWVTYTPAGTGAVATTVQAKLRESVSVKDFGADPTGVANATSAFNSAITYCKANNKGLCIPDGTYLLTADGVNFAGQGLAIYGEGKPTLQFTGSGRAFVMDTLLPNGNVFGDMRVENLRIVGGPSITDGFYSRGIVRSVFRNIEVRECNNNAFTILHGVSNQYDTLKFSTNEVAQTTTPTNGLVLNNNGVGYYTADCTFLNCIMEGFPGNGCNIVDGSGNVFVGGTFEAVSIGLTVSADCRRNHFINVWCEANTTRDLEVNSTANSFDDCYFGSNTPSGNNVEVVTGKGTSFRGGFIRVANLQATSSDTFFVGVGMSTSLGITGTGTYTRSSCTRIDVSGDVSGQWNDVLGTVQQIAFSATQVPSSNANTLDDYEEGTWTPVLTPAGGSITPNVSFTGGRYTKIGNLVTVNGCVYVTSVSSPTGALTITGLPFASKAGTTEYRAGSVFITDFNASATQPVMLAMSPAAAILVVAKLVSGVQTAMATDVKAASDIRFSITYQTNEI